MEKKRTLKTRFFAGLLALTMTGSPGMALAKGEEQLVQEETQVELIEMFKTDYEITNPDFGAFYENKYVSEDGKIEKWYCSYLPEIDGLKRTDEKRNLLYTDYAEGEICDIKSKHAHLCISATTGLLIPSYNEEKIFYEYGENRVKTKAIVEIEEKVLQILNEYKLYRLSDNLIFMQYRLDKINTDPNLLGAVYLQPKNITDNSFELTTIVDNGKIAIYDETKNGLLIMNAMTYANNDYNYDEDKTLLLKK